MGTRPSDGGAQYESLRVYQPTAVLTRLTKSHQTHAVQTLLATQLDLRCATCREVGETGRSRHWGGELMTEEPPEDPALTAGSRAKSLNRARLYQILTCFINQTDAWPSTVALILAKFTTLPRTLHRVHTTPELHTLHTPQCPHCSALHSGQRCPTPSHAASALHPIAPSSHHSSCLSPQAYLAIMHDSQSSTAAAADAHPTPSSSSTQRVSSILSALDAAMFDTDSRREGYHFDLPLAHVIHEYSRPPPCFLLRYRRVSQFVWEEDLHRTHDLPSMTRYLHSISTLDEEAAALPGEDDSVSRCQQLSSALVAGGEKAESAWRYVACIQGEMVDFDDESTSASPLSTCPPPFCVYESVDHLHHLHLFPTELALRAWMLSASQRGFLNSFYQLPLETSAEQVHTLELFSHLRANKLNQWGSFADPLTSTLFHSATRLDTVAGTQTQ